MCRAACASLHWQASLLAMMLGGDANSLERVTRGERLVCHLQSRGDGMHTQSHVPWEWSAKLVVNFICSSVFV